MKEGRDILVQFRNRWQLLLYVEAGIYALGFGFFLGGITGKPMMGAFGALLAGALSLGIRKPWIRDLKRSAAYVDARISTAGYSSGLLITQDSSLSGLSRLQRYRVAEAIREPVRKLIPPNGLTGAAIVSLLLILAVFGAKSLGWPANGDPANPDSGAQQIHFMPMDTIQEAGAPLPELVDQRIQLEYPAYTGMPDRETKDPNIRAVSGTGITWELRFEGGVSEVWLETGGASYGLRSVDGSFRIRRKLEASGFYSFRFQDSLGRPQISELYSLQAMEDRAPSVTLDGLPQYTYYEPGQEIPLDLSARISDDYGLEEAYIVATVSKGSGEAVKFREEQLTFDTPLNEGAKDVVLDGRIDLQDLGMSAGDELYFYVEARDRRTPEPNRGRSETYFAVIRDTVSAGFAVEGTLGVDRMPDYFRSQRQLIIDTEKLIAEAPELTAFDFKSRSNELGFDQKALRIKYGQFMGEEQELDMAPLDAGADTDQHEGEGHEEEGHEGHEHEGEEEDLLAGYTHDHDGDNEHNLVEESGAGKEDPLHDYLHDHGDPESATLFEESLRTKLRRALNVMWDAELQLRLYKPEASLPYQYQALRLIQEIKNSARIYVHRIGFDPPPIKEDKRLSGDISDLENTISEVTRKYEGTYPAMRASLARLEVLISGQSPYTNEDQALFQHAGEELAELALESPGRYLSTLRSLRATETDAGRAPDRLRVLRKELLGALPVEERVPSGEEGKLDRINTLFLQEINDG